MQHYLNEQVQVIPKIFTYSFGTFLEGLGGFIFGITMGCIFSWRIALIVLFAGSPFFISKYYFAANIRTKFFKGVEEKNLELSNSLKFQIDNIRTVLADNLQEPLGDLHGKKNMEFH